MENILIGQNLGREHEQGCGREQDSRSWAMLVHIKNEDMYDISGTFSLKSLTNYDMKLHEVVCVLTSKE